MGMGLIIGVAISLLGFRVYLEIVVKEGFMIIEVGIAVLLVVVGLKGMTEGWWSLKEWYRQGCGR